MVMADSVNGAPVNVDGDGQHHACTCRQPVGMRSHGTDRLLVDFPVNTNAVDGITSKGDRQHGTFSSQNPFGFWCHFIQHLRDDFLVENAVYGRSGDGD
jgi:hypothetical protein